MVTRADPRSLQHLSFMASRKVLNEEELTSMLPEILLDHYQNENPIIFADMYFGSGFEAENLSKL